MEYIVKKSRRAPRSRETQRQDVIRGGLGGAGPSLAGCKSKFYAQTLRRLCRRERY